MEGVSEEESEIYGEKMENLDRIWQQERVLPTLVNEYLPFSCEGSASSSVLYRARSSSSTIHGITEVKPGNSCTSHSQAEKRRRERINSHLSTLRRLIPSAGKLDKASLLGAVIEQVKELKRKACEIDKSFKLPSEIDEVTIESNQNGSGLTVSICCDDRLDLFADLVEALHGLKLRTVGADVTTVDGRVRSVFTVGARDGDEKSVCLSSLKSSLKAVLGRFVSSTWSPTGSFSLKRQRILSSSYTSMG